MRRLIYLLVFALLFLSGNSFAQQFGSRLDSLCILCNRSTSDSEKVVALGNLAEHYYIYKLNFKGDSVLHEQLLVTELSDNTRLVLRALFGAAILNISRFSSRESFDRTVSFIQKGIDYARSSNQINYLVLGYTRMSEVMRKRGEYYKSFLNCTSALSLLQNVSSDSVKSVAYIEIGESYLSRGEAVLACTHFNNAYDIAVKMNSVVLQSKIYHSLSEMYKMLGDDQAAKDVLRESMIMNTRKRNLQGLLQDYIDMARLTDEKYFIQRSIELADSLKDYNSLLTAKRLWLVYSYVVEKDQTGSFEYFNNDADLKQSYLNEGMGNYYNAVGNIFFYPGNIDSALKYYQLAEPELVKYFEKNLSMANFEQIGECYNILGETSEAIRYFEKALVNSRQLNDIKNVASYTGSLSKLFEKNGNFEKALEYSRQSDAFKDSIRSLSRQNDIALLGVDRENKRHQQDLLDLHLKEINNRNIQYFGITLTLIVIFFVMLFVGSFPVSKATVRLMGFFFFISLFEFVVLIIDNLVLSHSLRDQPFKIWGFKIALIAILAPLQHFLEHSVMRLLASRELITARTNFSVRRWWIAFRDRFLRTREFEEEDTVL